MKKGKCRKKEFKLVIEDFTVPDSKNGEKNAVYGHYSLLDLNGGVCFPPLFCEFFVEKITVITDLDHDLCINFVFFTL